MVDMGQADRSLYQRGRAEQGVVSWMRALHLATIRNGFDHYIHITDEWLPLIKREARFIRVQGPDRPYYGDEHRLLRRERLYYTYEGWVAGFVMDDFGNLVILNPSKIQQLVFFSIEGYKH